MSIWTAQGWGVRLRRSRARSLAQARQERLVPYL